MKVIEKVNPMHPDKIADRIAGAIVDLAYTKEENPKVAVEVLIGHGECNVIIESSVLFTDEDIQPIVDRITREDGIRLNLKSFKQDPILANNQSEEIKCGDNGIFKGVPLTEIEKEISKISREIYANNTYDGKYILSEDKLIVCQSNTANEKLKEELKDLDIETIEINPLGEWTGGTHVDTGCTNRKLGSDQAQSVTGGGLHGKDLSKADVSVNIYAFRKAQETGEVVQFFTAIGDDNVDGIPYSQIVEEAREYINELGGFEKFAEWGLF